MNKTKIQKLWLILACPLLECQECKVKQCDLRKECPHGQTENKTKGAIAMGNHILAKEQRDAGLDTHEDDHNLYITDTATGATVAVLGNHATIKEIHIAANYYLMKKAEGSHGNNQA